VSLIGEILTRAGDNSEWPGSLPNGKKVKVPNHDTPHGIARF